MGLRQRQAEGVDGRGGENEIANALELEKQESGSGNSSPKDFLESGRLDITCMP
jgi:hypothetical protein